MADLTPEENDRLMAQNDGVVFDEAQRFAETGELDDLPFATAEFQGTLLTDGQRQRIEALNEAAGLLLTDRPLNSGGFAGALVGANLTQETLLTKPGNYASDMMMLADYILDPPARAVVPTVVHTGDARTSEVRVHGDVPGGVIIMPGAPFPAAEVEPVSLECADPGCACTTGGGISGMIAIDSEGLDPSTIGERIRNAFKTEFGDRVVEPETDGEG
jgi:hypothetical protein